MRAPATIERDAIERFRAIVARATGLAFDETRSDFLIEALSARMAATGLSVHECIELAGRPHAQEEIAKLAEFLTIPETYFFRNMRQFIACRDVVLPDVLRMAGQRRVRLLSMGCASGEEAYSLAMVLRDSYPSLDDSVSIVGVDLNPVVLRKARAGRYSEWSLRETPPDWRARWFRQNGHGAMLDDSLKRSVTFAEGNLATDDPSLFAREPYDVVFCRNVLMYFTQEQCALAVARLSRAVAPGGYLFLGHAESLRALAQDFELCHSHETFYYRRKARRLSAFPKLDFPPLDRPESQSAVVDADGESAPRPAARPRAPLESPKPDAVVDLSAALALLGKEQYADALSLVRELPVEYGLDPRVRLLEAALLVHCGRLNEGAAACMQLLASDQLNAGAHYLIALCREGANDPEGAVHHHQVAAYLDPTFAMPRMHLGLLSRRSGDLATARRELAQARRLLEDEDSARLTMFGGGFTRGALVALCETDDGGAS